MLRHRDKQFRYVSENFEQKLDYAFGLLNEAYCPACGGRDVEEQGKGHRQGCPIGEEGSEIRGAGDRIRSISKPLFKHINELMLTFNRVIENARSPEYWEDQGVSDSNTMQERLSDIFNLFSGIGMEKEQNRLRKVYKSVSFIHEHAKHGDYVRSRDIAKDAKGDLEGLRHRIQILLEI